MPSTPTPGTDDVRGDIHLFMTLPATMTCGATVTTSGRRREVWVSNEGSS